MPPGSSSSLWSFVWFSVWTVSETRLLRELRWRTVVVVVGACELDVSAWTTQNLQMELLLPKIFDVTVRSETLPGLSGVTFRQDAGAVTVVGAHQRVRDCEPAAALAGDGATAAEGWAAEEDAAFVASAVSESVEEQRLADPRSWTT